MLKKIFLFGLLLLLIPLVTALYECESRITIKNIPCYVITAQEYNNCSGINITFWNASNVYLNSFPMNQYGALCSYPFNYSAPENYYFKAGLNETGRIEFYENPYQNDIQKGTRLFNFDVLNGSISGVLLWLMIFLIFFGLLIYAEISQISVLFFADGIMGVFLGIAVFSSLSAIIGIFIIISSAIVIIRGGFVFSK